MNRIAAQLQSMTVAELEGVLRLCSALAAAVYLILGEKDDRASADQAEPLAG